MRDASSIQHDAQHEHSVEYQTVTDMLLEEATGNQAVVAEHFTSNVLEFFRIMQDGRRKAVSYLKSIGRVKSARSSNPDNLVFRSSNTDV
ncbi:hypothetical protein [Solidesulfovibrio sp.]